jgi:uncharacterized protein (DUF1786 family)
LPVEKEYRFATDDGTKTLAERFGGLAEGPEQLLDQVPKGGGDDMRAVRRDEHGDAR